MIANNVSDYINLLVRIAHIICNHPIFCEGYKLRSSCYAVFFILMLSPLS